MTSDLQDSRPAAAAGTWLLGDRSVNRIGYGAMRLTGTAAFSLGQPSDRQRSIQALRTAVNLGVNHIDTASFYFSSLRSANELINRAFAPYPPDILVATKVGPARDSAGQRLPPAAPAQLRGQVEENLRQLGLDHLDLVYLRVQSRDRVIEHVQALDELSQAGLIRHVGLSGVTVEQVEQALAIRPIASVQNRFGLGSEATKDRTVMRGMRATNLRPARVDTAQGCCPPDGARGGEAPGGLGRRQTATGAWTLTAMTRPATDLWLPLRAAATGSRGAFRGRSQRLAHG